MYALYTPSFVMYNLTIGIKHWRRVQALNTDEWFINDMANLVVRMIDSLLPGSFEMMYTAL